ncbi:MAG TPA: DUF2232 domain-containing protein [Alphaproteobacteria bacterium]|jgi:hypothetical protein|nr:DUF2232 domain-containing protein [Alphaproteobacteria bacterium]
MSTRLQIIAVGALATSVLALAGDLGGPFGLLAAYFSTLPLFVVGFAAGTRACMAAMAIAAVVIAAASGALDAAMFVVAQGVPAALIVGLALRTRIAPTGDPEWYPAGDVLASVATYGALVFAAGTLAFAGQSGTSVEQTLAEMLERVFSAVAAESDPESVKAMAAALARYMPAFVLAGWTVMMVVNAVMGFQAARRFGSPQRPEPTWSAMTLPGWLMTATAAAALAALVGRGTIAGFIGGNAALALCVPYALLGFAVAHTFAAGAKYPWLVLWGVYLVVLLFGWPLFFMAAVGFAEDWIGLRRHIAGPRPEPEDER